MLQGRERDRGEEDMQQHVVSGSQEMGADVRDMNSDLSTRQRTTCTFDVSKHCAA